VSRLTTSPGLHTRERVFFQDVSAESRFGPEANQTKFRSVICIPMSNNRGQVYGALFLGNNYPFSQNHASILSLLVRQASISIANALLFKSVQQATKANLQMIQSQRQALEEARKSREDAMKATKIKSNFLASMSHELRTPFRCVSW
jgi:GAF domain-containing protein